MIYVPRFEGSESIIQSYVEATEALTATLEHGKWSRYQNALAALCRGLTRLHKADRFWSDLQDVSRSVSRDHQKMVQVLGADFEGFIEREKFVLTKFIGAQEADALIKQVSASLSAVMNVQTFASVGQLQRDVASLREVTCGNVPIEPSRFQQFARAMKAPLPEVLVNGCSVLGGTAVATANSIAASVGLLDPEMAAASIGAGIDMARQPFRKKKD